MHHVALRLPDLIFGDFSNILGWGGFFLFLSLYTKGADYVEPT